MTTAARPSRHRWWAVLPVAGMVITGVWVAGGLLTDDYRVAQVATGAFLVVAAVLVLVASRRFRAAGPPMVVGFLLSTAVVGSWLAVGSTRDVVVDEAVVTAAPVSETATAAAPSAAAAPSTAAPSTDAAPTPTRVEAPAEALSSPVLEASGTFRSGSHETTGGAEVVRTDDQTVVILRELSTDPGPDLRLLAVPPGGGIGDARDLGALKGNVGTQQYVLPAEVAAGDVGSVVLWCRAFSVEFGTAELV